MSGPARPRRPLIEALEPRMLFSATADIAVFDDGSSDPDYLAQASQAVDLTQIYPHIGAEDSAPDVLPADVFNVKSLDTLVIVDTSVKDYEVLVEDIRQAHANQSLEILYLEPGDDGIAEITQALNQYTGINSVHLISHGDTDSLQLGTVNLSIDTLLSRESEVAKWRDSLSDNADILLYGCDIAAADTGRNLLDKLAVITQADIAASNDVTGHKSLGGDWDLEYSQGDIETSVILSQQVQEQWQHTLTVLETSGSAPDTLFVKSDAQAYQSFVHTGGTGAYIVNEISLQMMRNQFADQTAQAITVSLISGSYNGSVLASVALSSNSLSTTMSWVDFSIGSQSLTYGQTYYIKVTTSSTVQLVQLGIHNTDAYSGGNFVTHFGVADTSRDLGFEVSSNNNAPTVANAIPNQNATEDSAFSYQFASNTFNDVDGNTLTYSAQLAGGGALPSWLSFNSATRTFSGTPLNANVGAVSIDVIASDGNGGTVTDTFNITVANTNDAPTVANAIPNQNATEDSAFSYQFPSNTFADVDAGATLTYSAQLAGGGALPSWLTFNSATRTFSGTPLNANVGTVSIDVIASDGNGGTVTDTFNITVANTNDAPTVANAIPNQNATEDSAFNFQFASNTFADIDAGATLTYSAQLAGGGTLPSWLSFNSATRTFSGTPLNANVGTVSIDVIASDGNGGTVTDTFNITVANTNDAPTVANAIPNQNATEDSAFSYQFPSNTFADVDAGATLTYSAQLAGGGALPSWLSFNSATRTFSGTPLNANVGAVSIDVIASDGNGGSVTDTFNITVANTNDAPTVANVIPNQNATEDSAFSYQFASNTFNDVDGNTLTYSAQLAGGGALPSWLSFNSATRTFSGTPLNTNVGTVSIDVIASDGNGGSVTDTFDITVANTNDAPTVANPIANQTATENSLFNFTFAVNTFTDQDVGNTLTYTAQLSGGGALPAWLSFDANTRTFSGTPSNGDIGTISVEVTANDGSTSVSDTFDLVVQNVGSTNFTYESSGPSVDTIVLSPGQGLYQTFTHTSGGGTYTIDTIILQLQRDVSAQLQTITVSLMQTFNGAVIDSATMSSADIDTTLGWEAFDFTNLVLTDGQEYFIKVEASGNDGLIRTGIHNTNVYADGMLYYNSGTPDATRDLAFQVASGTNTDPSIANPIPNQNATEDAAFNFQFASNTFSDADVGDTLTYTATMADGSALPSWLSFNAATRTFSGTPANADVGTISVKVTADDGNGGTPASDTFDLVIANTNDAPTIANPIPNQSAFESAAFNFQFASNTFSDADAGNALAYTAQLAGGSALPVWLSFNNATRTFSGVPDDGNVGTLTIEVIADDGNGGTVTDTFTLNVININDDPFLNIPIPDQNATEDSAFNYTFPGNTFGDGDIGASFTYTAQLSGGGALPSWLNFDSNTRTFSGTPTNGDVGAISIEVTVDDGNGGPASDIFDLVIANTNDAPTVTNAIPNQTATESTAFNFQFASNVFDDVDTSDTLTYSATLTGGGALPSWLSFDAVTRTFIGVPATLDVGTMTIDVTADDGNGGTIIDSFTLTVAALDDTNYIDTGTGGHFYPVSSVNQLGQSFSFDSAGSTYTVNEISLYLARYGSAVPQTITVELRDAWNGAVIATDTIASSQINDTGFEWHSFDFSDVVLNDNQSYVIQISTDANDDSILVSRFDSDTFTDGALIQNGVPDAAGWDLAFKVSKDDGLNSAPTLDNPIVDQTVNAESPFNLVVPANTFSDPDANDTLTYRAQLVGGGSLDWLTFNEITRTFSGTPHWHQAGTMQVELIATDNHGASTSAIFEIEVINTNNPPTVANPIPDQNATEDTAFNFQFASNTFNDADVGNTFTYSAQLSGGGGLPSWLSFDATTRTFSGTPANSDVGALNIEVIANDGYGGSVTDSFTLVVANTNDVPTLANAIPDQNATEDTPFNFQFAVNTFADQDVGDTLTYSVQMAGGGVLPTWLSFDATTRTFSGTPANGDVGTFSVEVTADDGNGGTATETFDVVVANTNDAPTVANAITDQNVTEDSIFNFQFAANTFADADLDALSYTAQLAGGGALPTWLSFDAATRTFSGTPTNSDVGTISIDVIADDGNGGTVTGTFDIVIANANDVPTVANTIPDQNATEDTAFNFQFAANSFDDIDTGDTLTYTAQLAGGGALPSWLSFDTATRTFSGTPTNGDVGTISIDVVADDGNGGTVTDTFNIVIANANDAPTVANAIADQNATEDAAFNFQFAANTFADADLDALTYSAQLAGGGSLPGWLSFDAVTRTFSGTPTNGDVGTISIDVIAGDGNGGTVTDTFNIVIANANDAPTVANAIPDQNAAEDAVFNFQFAVNTFDDQDVGDTLIYTAQVAGGGALPSWLNFDAATRTFSGTPANSDVGTISIDVIANDGNGGTATDTFNIVIANVNDAPTIANTIADQNATEDAAFNFQFASNTFTDADLDTLSYAAQLAGGGALPSWLSFDSATRTFSGIPSNGDVGTISIDVIADDGNGGTVTDTFNIVIANTNDAPTVANAIADQNATEDTAFNFQFAVNSFNDIDSSDTLTYTAQLAGGGALPSWLSFDAVTRTFSGTPTNSDVGTVSIDVIADDGNGGTVTDTFNIIVANANDAPTIANSIPDQNATEDTAFNFQFAINTFTDPDLNTLTYSAQLAGGGALPAWLSFDAVTRTFSGTPTNGDVGTISIDVIADDGGGGTVADTFNIVITNANDAPTVANAIADQNATEDTAFNFQFAVNTFADADLDSLSYTAQLAGGGALPAWLSFDAATRTFNGTPANGDVGSISIDVIADDGNGSTVTDTFSIVIANSNDAPTVANIIPDQNATEDAVFNYQFAVNTFADADLDALSYTVQLAGGGALPAWLSFDATTRTFSGTPVNGDVGTISIDVIADDGNGGTVTDTFSIVIANSNDAPTVNNAIADQNATEDTAFNFILPANTFYDLDSGDVLTYSAQLAGGGALPAWLSFDAATDTFSGTPTETDVGTLVVEVIATDSNGESVYDSFNINIAAVNDAPATTGLNVVNNLEDAAGDQVNLWSAFNDQEESASDLTYTIISNTNPGLVTGATVDPATGQLQVTYGANQFGTAELIIRAQDSQGAIVETPLVINIASVNDNPLGDVIADIETSAGQAPMQFNLRNFFNDIEDGTNLTYSVQSNSNAQIVPQIQINQATGQMTLVFAATLGGETEIVLRAQDSAGAWVELNFTVTLIPRATQPGGETPGTEPPDTSTPPTQPPIVVPPVTNPPTNELPDDEDDETIIPVTPPAQEDSGIANPGDSGGVLDDGEDDRNSYAHADDKSSRDYQRYEQAQQQANSNLTLLNASAGASLISPDAGFMPWELADFNDEMRRMREQMDEAVADEERKKAAIAGVTFSVTTGLLIWSLRASSLLLTLFSMLPLWRGMDPLPILEEVNKRKKEMEEQRKDRQREDKSAKEVGYLFDNTRQDQGNYRS